MILSAKVVRKNMGRVKVLLNYQLEPAHLPVCMGKLDMPDVVWVRVRNALQKDLHLVVLPTAGGVASQPTSSAPPAPTVAGSSTPATTRGGNGPR